MKFVEVVSEAEQKVMQDYIERWGSIFSVRRKMNAPLSHVMRFWEDAKNDYLYKLLGNQLILEKDYEWGDSSDQLIREMRNKLVYADKHNDFRWQWERILQEKLLCPRNDDYYQLINLTGNAYPLVTNEVNLRLDVPMPNGKVYKIEPLTKTAKVIRKIASAYDIPGYEEFLLDQSRVLNVPSRKVKLCLSIHPMDYLTMSENTTWHSCMKWSDEGDYRAGTVEMMNSPCVVCAYAYWSDFTVCDDSDYTWNDKRWRKLYIVDRDIIVGVRAYPYDHNKVDLDVLNWLRELAETNLDWHYEDGVIEGEGEEGEALFFDDHEGHGRKIWMETNLMYNDFYYKHNLFLREGYSLEPIPDWDNTINYSGASECMFCGDYFDEGREEAYRVACYDCDRGDRCDGCGEEFIEGSLEEIHGLHYCEYCMRDRVGTDFFDGERYPQCKLQKIEFYRTLDDGSIVMSHDDEYCIWVKHENFDKFVEKYPSCQTLCFTQPYWWNRVRSAVDVNALYDDEESNKYLEFNKQVLINCVSWYPAVYKKDYEEEEDEDSLPF
jgi:hypothetical protein